MNKVERKIGRAIQLAKNVRLHRADGGETDPMLNQDTSIYDNPYKDQVISEYKPTFRDRLAAALSGDTPSFDKQRIVENVTGSRGLGPTKIGLVDAIPVVGNVLGADEALREGDYKGAAMAMMPMPPAIKTEGRVLKAAEKLVAGEHVPVKAPDPYVKGVNDRKPELEKAIKDFYEGNITRGEYDDIVRNILPVTPYEFIPRPAPEDLAVDALNAAKKDKYAMNRNIYREGDPVSLRLDIPAYTNLPNSQWVNSIHDTQGIHPTTYDSVSAARNVDFVVPENKARMTGEGGPKAPYAVMRGEYVPINADEAVAKAREIMEGPLPSQWQQVGMDPRRHSYFYTRDERMMPVTNADEVLQIGPVVYAKNPKIGDRENFGYAEGGRVELADGGSPPWGFDFNQPTIDFQPQQPSVPPLADLDLYKGAPLNKPPEPPQEEQKQEEDNVPVAPHRPEGSGSDGSASTTAPSQPDFALEMGPPASAAPSPFGGLATAAGFGPGMTVGNTVGGLVGGLVGTAVAGPFGGLIGGVLGRHAANAISAQDEDEDSEDDDGEDDGDDDGGGGNDNASSSTDQSSEQSGKSDSSAETATGNMQDGGAITMRRYRANGGPIKVSPSHAEAGPSKISPAQAKAGNYRKKHLNFQGLPLAIETPKGHVREKVINGKVDWRVKMPVDYGYVKGTKDNDGDASDVFVGPHKDSDKVWVIDQADHHTGKFDEHKAMLGFKHKHKAIKAYKDSFSDGKAHKRIMDATKMSVDEYKDWIKHGNLKKPVSSSPFIQKALMVASKKS